VVKFESSFGSFLAQILEILAIKTHFAPFALSGGFVVMGAVASESDQGHC
jgi:hypothetical protein